MYRRPLILALTALSLGPPCLADDGVSPPRERVSLDAHWRFALGHGCDPQKDFGFGTGTPFAKAGEAVGAARPTFDDSVWRQVDLPHDWAVELDFVEDPDGDHVNHGSKPVSRRFPETTIGWYRKHFDIPKSDDGRRLSVEFDGVFRDCDVWLNGHLVAHNQSGYSGFAFDATDYINYGGDNTLVVRADASQYEGWFYEGAGIYRHVWLVKTGPVHVARDGVQVTTSIAADFQSAVLTSDSEIINESAAPATVSIRSRLLNPAGEIVGRAQSDAVAIPPWQSISTSAQMHVDHPSLWSPDHPSLYRIVTEITRDGKTADELPTRFGFRTAVFDKDRGFLLNGKPVKIKGVCCHQDHAGVGSALPDAIQYFRIATLKDMGANAYRTSHHPPTPELLDACDELGMLILDEHRLIGSSDEILSQLRRFVKRDRNRPCVIAWSIGNEEPEQYTTRGARIAETMIRTVRSLDPTRQITFAANSGGFDKGINAVVDVRGFNYFMDAIEPYHKKHPDQPLLCTETASSYYTRGEYAADKARGYVSAYDNNKPDYGATAEEWVRLCMTTDYLAGGFCWTGFDYRGEPSPYAWPCISSHFGIIDTCGFLKDVYYYYKSWWGDKPIVHLLPHWNWDGKEGQNIDVWCFSNCERVTLALNGKDLGSRSIDSYGHAQWSVPYEPGELVAIGFNGGREVQRMNVQTTGRPASIALQQEPTHAPPGHQDALIVTVAAVDAEGRTVPTASSDISFTIEGPAEIIGVGNGDPSSHEADRFVPHVHSTALTDWQTVPLSSKPDASPSIANLEKLGARAWNPAHDATSMHAPGFAAFWCKVRADDTDLNAPALGLAIGRIDDHGWIYLNGVQIAESHDWDAPVHADLTGKLHAGDNELVIIVKNDQGPGGLGRGVSLVTQTPAPPWHRHLFNGLAQVIIRPGPGPDPIKLTATSEGLQPAAITLPR